MLVKIACARTVNDTSTRQFKWAHLVACFAESQELEELTDYMDAALTEV